MDTKTHDVLDAINRSHREIIAKQEETLEFVRAQAERSDRIRQEAVALQKQAEQSNLGCPSITMNSWGSSVTGELT